MGQEQKLSDSDFLELYKEGLMDIEIAEIMGVSNSCVNARRRKMGLPKNKQHSRSAKVWKAYDPTTGQYITEGTAFALAQALGVVESTIYYYADCGRKGVRCRYELREVTE